MARTLKFAVVREDPCLEAELVRRLGCGRVAVIGSGGCTALSLQAWFPALDVTILDPNPAQLAHVRAKQEALIRLDAGARAAAFNVGRDDPEGLSERGAFEALFRGLRSLLQDLVLPRGAMLEMFEDPAALEGARRELLASPYWPAAFEMYFCAPLLEAMFGVAATQHAAPGSYPAYFRALFERGLDTPGARDNPFLRHVFLGQYRDDPASLPAFLQASPPRRRLVLVGGRVPDLPDLGSYDLVSLSNIFDWMPPAEVASLVEHLGRHLRPGAAVLYRQLNNSRDLEALFGARFAFDPGLGEELRNRDRSLFYSSVHVGVRSQGP